MQQYQMLNIPSISSHLYTHISTLLGISQTHCDPFVPGGILIRAHCGDVLLGDLPKLENRVMQVIPDQPLHHHNLLVTVRKVFLKKIPNLSSYNLPKFSTLWGRIFKTGWQLPVQYFWYLRTCTHPGF